MAASISSVAPARPVIFDCDPGHDDALAIALAVIRPELEVLGLTTVAGNAELEATTRNAGRILALLGRSDIPVAAGAEGPLVRDPWIPVEFHGESGLDGADMPEPGRPPEPVTALANRDPATFPDADTVDLHRPSRGHAAFGAGIHYCLGAPLARLELQTAFATILRRMPRLTLLEPPVWKPTFVLRGLAALRVRC